MTDVPAGAATHDSAAAVEALCPHVVVDLGAPGASAVATAALDAARERERAPTPTDN